MAYKSVSPCSVFDCFSVNFNSAFSFPCILISHKHLFYSFAVLFMPFRFCLACKRNVCILINVISTVFLSWICCCFVQQIHRKLCTLFGQWRLSSCTLDNFCVLLLALNELVYYTYFCSLLSGAPRLFVLYFIILLFSLNHSLPFREKLSSFAIN